MMKSAERIAYLVSEYPKVSHTFIQREVAGLRVAGLDVATYSIREPSAVDLRGAAERAEHASTRYIFPDLKRPTTLFKAHWQVFRADARAYGRSLITAVRFRPAGLKALVYQLAYFAEAGILAQQLQGSNTRHLHVHFANPGCTVGLLTSEMTGIPFSFTMHGPTEFFDVERQGVPLKISRARFVVCISHFCRSQLMLFSEKTSWDKFNIIRCAIDPDLYASKVNRDPKNILFVGRMSGVKGVSLILNAIAKLRIEFPGVTATLVGDGDERVELEAQAENLGVSDCVTFTGYQSQEEVAAHMRRAAIFTLPSFAEGLPVVLMEALASQTPVVTTRIAGVGELVKDQENGLLIAPGDQEGLVDALATLLRDSKRRKKMGEMGGSVVATAFNTNIESIKLAELFRDHL